MGLTLAPILASAGVDAAAAIAIRHSYLATHSDGTLGLHTDSTDHEILAYTSVHTSPQFPKAPPPTWVIFIPEGPDRARLWAVAANRGMTGHVGQTRTFDLEITPAMDDLRSRLVIKWNNPRSWCRKGTTVARQRVLEIADAQPIRFPGFDRLILDYTALQAVVREHRYASWRTALSAVIGIYLITDTRTGKHYVGKADGAETLLQRWSAYAANGHGDNVELKKTDPSGFRFSVLRVFDPATSTQIINATENHYKNSLDSRHPHGLNRN